MPLRSTLPTLKHGGFLNRREPCNGSPLPLDSCIAGGYSEPRHWDFHRKGETHMPAFSDDPPVVHAPDFMGNLDWINTDHPLHLSDLKGKIVLLDFWTYG